MQAERIMEALELYREEGRKMEEHRYACENAGKEVQTLIRSPAPRNSCAAQLHFASLLPGRCQVVLNVCVDKKTCCFAATSTETQSYPCGFWECFSK